MSEILQALYRGDRVTAEQVANSRGDDRLTVFEAAALGRLDALRARLTADPSAAIAVADDGFTALHLAAFLGGAAAVDALLDGGADPAAVAANDMRVQPLHSAVAAHDPAAVLALLRAGAPPDARQQQGFTALQAAAHHGETAIVDMLLAAGADPSVTNDEGRTAADLAAAAGHRALAEHLRSPDGHEDVNRRR